MQNAKMQNAKMQKCKNAKMQKCKFAVVGFRAAVLVAARASVRAGAITSTAAVSTASLGARALGGVVVLIVLYVAIIGTGNLLDYFAIAIVARNGYARLAEFRLDIYTRCENHPTEVPEDIW
jgi:hypothetical protein